MKIKPHRIGPRIFMELLLVFAVLFASAFIAFNIFFGNYIYSTAYRQLDKIETDMVSFVTDGGRVKPDEDNEKPSFPDLTSVMRNTIRSEAMVFNTDNDYNVTDFNSGDSKTELCSIAASMKNANVSLENADAVHISTNGEEYFVSSVTDPVLADTYMVFSLNVTGINELWRTINTALIIIMAASLILCLLLASAITRTVTAPIHTLSAFAEEIGKGNFERHESKFRDEEFSELESAMNDSAVKLEQYENEQRTFFQNVSHELRTPLMSIRCYAEGIACSVMEPASSAAVILSETDRLSELVEDLLYISRIDRCEVPEKAEDGDLRETVSLCATGLNALAEKNKIKITCDFDSSPVHLVYNENHMCKAVNNLISNALRYAKKEIKLTCLNDGDEVIIAVSDDGKGISDEDFPHIFERFYKGNGGKSGIGLSIVKSVAELYGGTVYAERESGTRFVMRFPKK